MDVKKYKIIRLKLRDFRKQYSFSGPSKNND